MGLSKALLGLLRVRLTVEKAADFDRTLINAGKQVQDFGMKVINTGQKMTTMGKWMSTRVTAPMVAAAAVAVKSASDLNESMNKTVQVFGQASSSVIDFAEHADRSLGMSESAALEATSTFGNLFTSMGMGRKPAAEMSMGLVKLAGDLASFNNLNPQEVFEKLRSGIVGEVEPLRSLGINLSQAVVQQKALQMGLAKTKDQLTPLALMQARYALIMEQTINAQGDFGRTSTGLANGMRILRAEAANVAAEFGAELYPLATLAMQGLVKLLGKVREGIRWFDGLNPRVKAVIVVFGGLVVAAGPVLIGLGMLTQVVGLAMGGLGALVSTVGAVGGAFGAIIGVLTGPIGILLAIGVASFALYKMWTHNTFGIRDVTRSGWKSTLTYMGRGLQWAVNAVHAAVSFITRLWDAGFAAVNKATGGRLQVLVDGIRKGLKWIYHAHLWTWKGVAHIVLEAMASVVRIAGEGVAKAAEKLAELLEKIPGMEGMAQKLRQVADQARRTGLGLAAGLNTVANISEGDFEKAIGYARLAKLFKGAPVKIGAELKGIYNKAKGAVDGLLGSIDKLFASAGLDKMKKQALSSADAVKAINKALSLTPQALAKAAKSASKGIGDTASSAAKHTQSLMDQVKKSLAFVDWQLRMGLISRLDALREQMRIWQSFMEQAFQKGMIKQATMAAQKVKELRAQLNAMQGGGWQGSIPSLPATSLPPIAASQTEPGCCTNCYTLNYTAVRPEAGQMDAAQAMKELELYARLTG